MNTETAQQVKRQPRSTSAAPTPNAHAAGSGVSPVRTRRPVGYLAAAIALVIVGGLVSVFFYTSSQSTQDVFVAARTIDRGEVIDPSDLSTIAVAAGQQVQGFTASEKAQVIGKVATVVVPRGGLVTPDSVANNLPVPEGLALVGLSLNPAQLPSVQLRAGDKVVLTPVAQQTGVPAAVGADLDVAGTVVDNPTVTPTSGTTVVNVYVSQSVASDLAGRAAAGLVALYLTSAG